jgi:cobalt-zinc-cadmium efflux system membrane fusion protein
VGKYKRGKIERIDSVRKSTGRRWVQITGERALVAVFTLALPVSTAEERAVPEARASNPDGSLVLSGSLRTVLGVRSEPVRRTDLAPKVDATGIVRFAPRHAAEVGARLSGIVRTVRHVVGDAVAEGEVLASVDSAELALLESEADVYRARVNAANLHEARVGRLLEGGYSTARSFESSQAVKKVLDAELAAARRTVTTLGGGSGHGSRAIRAPKAGTIVAQHISIGQSLRGDEVAFEIADPTHLWVEVSVDEKNVLGIHEGDAVEVKPVGRSHVVLECRVDSVGSSVDETTMTVPVRIRIDDPERKLRSGEAVRARLDPSGRKVHGALVVPRSSVSSVDGQSILFVEGDEGRLTPTKVELGETDGMDQRILSGVTMNSTVVTAGTEALRGIFYR